MLHARQKLLLCLLQTVGGSAAATDFQKLLFLFTQEFEPSPTYEFVPYKFGSFSFTSYADKRRLTESGLLEEDENVWRLTTNGERRARPNHPMAVALHKFRKLYGKLRGNDLLANVYKRYPFYAIRSEIVEKEKVLPDADSRARIQDLRPKALGPSLITIGYEGKTLEGYMNQLLHEGVTLLCDVRRNPISRKFGFSKGTLSTTCDKLGLRYAHLPELGIASEERQDLRVQADYDALFADYEHDLLPKEGAALDKIMGWIRDGQRVGLTCFELNPQQCHRHCISNLLGSRFGKSLVIRHLGIGEKCRSNAS
jgi:hypothetical protein